MVAITCVSDYIEAIKSSYSELYPHEMPVAGKSVANGFFYRCHSKADKYKLEPTVLRDDNKGKEKTFLLNFRDYMPQHNVKYNFVDERIEMLAIMQHYAIPTRLMDWTFSPLVALYFAVKNKNSEDGAVWIFNPWSYVQSRAELKPRNDWPDLHSAHIFGRALLSDRHKNTTNIKHAIQAKYGIDFEDFHLQLPFPFVSSFNNNRILHQRGCFTIHGTSDDPLDIQLGSDSSKFLTKLQISNKTKIYSELRMLFVNEYTIYPDFEGMSALFKEDQSLYKTHFNFS